MSGKISKAAAQYRLGSDLTNCGKPSGCCDMFREAGGGSCTLVEGHIARDHVCRYWEAKRTVQR